MGPEGDGGSVNGQEISDPKFHPFWAKAEPLGVVVFVHPQGTAELNATTRLKGNGLLDNVIGNPLVDHIPSAPGRSDTERAAMLGGTAAKLLGIEA